MRDTKQMLGNKIVRFKTIYKFSDKYFFIGVISLLLFIKSVLIKIKHFIFPNKMYEMLTKCQETNLFI